MMRWSFLLAAVLACAGVGEARAEEPNAPNAPIPRSDPAHYRGRPEATSAADALLWLPRAAFFPMFLATELVLRRPVYAAAEWVDENHVVPIIERILKPTKDFSWSPIVSLDLGAYTSVGVEAKLTNLGVPGHELEVSGETGGADNYRFTLRDRLKLGPHTFAGLRAEASLVPNRAFHGMGPRSSDVRYNFSQERHEGFVFAGVEIGNHLRVELSEGLELERTSHGWPPSIGQRFTLSEIPGLGELHLALAKLDLTVDSRRTVDDAGGFRLDANVTYGRDLRETERSFLTATLDVEAGVEVSVPDRVLAARLHLVDTFALGREPVPFTHQAMLGFSDHHGFIWGRFRGDSAAMLELHYRYPIAYFVDALWTASAGNVFGERWAGFSVDALTGSIGVGLRTRRVPFGPVEVTFALGTSRFEEPFAFESVRVYFATTEGL